jgi:hypothetical protein
MVEWRCVVIVVAGYIESILPTHRKVPLSLQISTS